MLKPKDLISAAEARKLKPKAVKQLSLDEIDAEIRKVAADWKTPNRISLNYAISEEETKVFTDKKYTVNINANKGITIIRW